MITLLENALTSAKHTYNFVDHNGKVIGFNPYPNGTKIRYEIRDGNGKLIQTEQNMPIEFSLVGCHYHFDNDISFSAPPDDDTFAAMNFTMTDDFNKQTIVVHIEGQGGDYYCEDIGLTEKDLIELFKPQNIQQIKTELPKRASFYKFNPTNRDFKPAHLIDISRFVDNRGLFSPYMPQFNVCQINFSESKRGVIRGMHWQKKDAAQQKQICVLNGKIVDVVLDLRKGSPTYQQVKKFELNSIYGPNPTALYVPAGFAHGFQALEDNTKVMYLVDKPYNPDAEMIMNAKSSIFGEDCFAYDIAIQSTKDENAPTFFEISEEDYPED